MLVIGWIAYVNRGSQQTFEVLKPIFGGVTIAFFFMLVNIFMTPVSKKRYETDLLILFKRDCSIVPLEDWTYRKFGMESFPMGGYAFISNQHHRYLQSLSRDELEEITQNLFEDKNLNEEIGYPYLLDLVEWSTFIWMEHYYGKHWETRCKNFKGISAETGRGTIPVDAAKQVDMIPIKEILLENRFAQKGENMFSHAIVSFPKGTKVSYDRERKNHTNSTVTIETSNIIVMISFQIGMGGNIGTTDLAEIILKKENDAGWNQQLIVSITAFPKRLRRWSQESEKQLSWIEDFAKIFDDRFSWDLLKDKLRKSLGVDMYWSKEN